MEAMADRKGHARREGAGGALRLFVAVRCGATAPLREVLSELAHGRPSVKPVPADGLHLTLRFLGDTASDRVPAIAQALEQGVSRAAVGPFDLHWRGLGRFPSNAHKPARVVFAGPANPEAVQRLADAIRAALDQLDPPLSPDDRPFAAHLTLARIKSTRGRPSRHKHRRGREGGAPTAIDELCRRYAQADLGRSHITAVELLSSTLTPDGPIHTVQHAVKL